MKSLLKYFLFCFSFIGVIGSVNAQTILRVSNWLPPTHHITTNIIQVWADNVEKATNGRVKVQLLPALGKPEAHFDLVKNGVADIAMGVDGYTADRFKLPYAVKLPFLADDGTAATVAYWRTHQKHFAKYNEFDGVKLIALWVHTPGHIYTVNKKVARVDDLKGMKIRVPGDVVQEIATELGIVPVFAPASQAFDMLSKGVVDGIFFNHDSIRSFKLERAVKHALIFPTGLYRDSHYMIMNQKKFDSLSKSDKDAIDSVSGEVMAWIAGKAWDEADTKAMDLLKSMQFDLTVASPALQDEIKKKLQPLETKWLDRAKSMGLDGRAVLEDYKSEITKVKAEMKTRK